MAAPTRLDRLVRLRDNEEEEALKLLADAVGRVQSAGAALEALQRSATLVAPGMETAGLWEARDTAATRLRSLIEQARRELVRARQGETIARRRHELAHQRTEALRRVADTRREEQQLAIAHIEAREADEMAFSATSTGRDGHSPRPAAACTPRSASVYGVISHPNPTRFPSS